MKMKKLKKTEIFLVCEGKIETRIRQPKLLYVAKNWIKKNHLVIGRELGKLEDISKIITITTHREIAEKKLYDYVKRYGFSKIPNYDICIITEPLVLNHDTALVSVRRNYLAKKTILFDYIYNKYFNARRYL